MNKTDTFIEKIEKSKEGWDYETALQIALEGLNTQMNDYRLFEELADIYIFQGKLEKAEEVIHYARELHPTSGTWLFLEGYILTEKWDFNKALEVLNKANNLYPNNAEILQNIGWSYVMLGDMSRGVIFLRRAASLAPEEIHIQNRLATAMLLNEEINQKK